MKKIIKKLIAHGKHRDGTPRLITEYSKELIEKLNVTTGDYIEIEYNSIKKVDKPKNLVDHK
jgi:hypothetical protein